LSYTDGGSLGQMRLHEARLAPRGNDGFLIALLHRIRSEPAQHGIRLHVDLHDDLPAIVSDEGKKLLFASLASVDRTPIRSWMDRARSGVATEYCNDGLPLRWASGGALAVAPHREAEYFVLSYRNIFPHGWNLFVGHAGDWEDLVDIGRILEREFREEAILYNRATDTSYAFNIPGQKFDPQAFQAEALSRWSLLESHREILPCDVVRGPDSVTVSPRTGGADSVPHTSEGLFLVIDPEALGIECMQIVRMPLPDEADLKTDLVFLDGELHTDGLLDSAIALLDIERYKQWMAEGSQGDLPLAHVYQSCKHLDGGIADSKQIRDDWEHRNDFCPVTAEMIARWPTAESGEPM